MLIFQYLHGIFFIGGCDKTCTYLQNGKKGHRYEIMQSVQLDNDR